MRTPDISTICSGEIIYKININDAAERSVALMTCFNESIARNEAEMQKLVQGVEHHRKCVSKCSKAMLMKSSSLAS